MQLAFLRQISNSRLGKHEHPLFLLPIETQSSEPTLCKDNLRGTSPQLEQRIWPKRAASHGGQFHASFPNIFRYGYAKNDGKLSGKTQAPDSAFA